MNKIEGINNVQIQTKEVSTPDKVNYITVTITAEDGTQKEYNLVVEKLPNNT